jgi:hypothetical protein
VSPELVLGRDREVAAVRTAIESGLQHGSVMLVVGDPGIGKSALLGLARTAGIEAEVGRLTGASNRSVPRAEVLVTAAKAAALRGEIGAALDLVTEVEHSPSARGGSSTLARAQIARGIAYLSAGRHVDAFVALSRVFKPQDPSHHHREQFGAVMYLADAAARSGQHDAARVVVTRMQRPAEVSGSPLLAAQMGYARAVLAPGPLAEDRFLSFLASDLAAWTWPRARVQLAYGRWLRRQRR